MRRGGPQGFSNLQSKPLDCRLPAMTGVVNGTVVVIVVVIFFLAPVVVVIAGGGVAVSNVVSVGNMEFHTNSSSLNKVLLSYS